MNTICAPATLPGGAIGIIRISGDDAIDIVNSIFSKDISDAKGYTMHFGNIINRDVIDQVIVSVFRAPHSYTGEDSAEISCHGSNFIISEICAALCHQGAVMAAPGEFTQRAFVNGKMDLSQAEAVADLIASNSAASHRIAMQHLRGGISQKLSQLRANLLNITSLMELELDFSDHEDIEFADRNQLLALANNVKQEICRLINSFSTGNALKNGIPVAIIGAPNVGKSTLLNQLLEDDKAIVSDIKGTTRDVIEDTIVIGGTLFRFIDTAGIRKTDNMIETLGIERSIKAAERAKIIILLTEPGVPYPEIQSRPDQIVFKIINKTEEFQAISGKGLEELKQQLISSIPNTDADEVLITNSRHKQSLELAHSDITRVIESIDLSISTDLISEDLRQCITHLSEITGGQITPDEVLGNIFKHFCIGK